MNSNHKSRRLPRSTYRRPSPCVPITVAAAAALVAVLAGCGGPVSRTSAQADDKATGKAQEDTGVRLLWVGDSIAGAEAPALGAAFEASGVDFKDASSDGGGTVVAGSQKITWRRP